MMIWNTNLKLLAKRLIIFICFFMFITFTYYKTCVLKDNIEVNLYNDKGVKIVDKLIKTLKLPSGIFRNILWPDNGQFTIVLGRAGYNPFYWEEEHFFYFPTPKIFSNKFVVLEQSCVAEKITLLETSNLDKCKYKIVSKKSRKQFLLELPSSEYDYAFQIIKDDKNTELLVFCNGKPFVRNRALFGYIVMSN